MIDEALFRSANQLRNAAFVSDQARQMAGSSQHESSPPFLDELLAAGLDQDALRMLPYTMTVRHGVWWNCLCIWHACGANPAPTEDRALRCIFDWLRSPTADSAKHAVAVAGDDVLQNPLGCCGSAIRLISSANDRRLLSGTAKLLGHGAMLSLRSASDRNVPASARQFVHFGFDVIVGKAPWN